MGTKQYYVKDGQLVKASDQAPPKVLVGSIGDLEPIKDKLIPGTQAHTPGYANVWELSPEKNWINKLFPEEDEIYNNLIAGRLSELNASAKSIRPYAFASFSTLTKVEFPEYETISFYAFYACYDLSEASFPKCETIGSHAFELCNLSIASFPNCKSIYSTAFARNSSLTEVYFPVCKTISTYAFHACNNISIIDFPECTRIEESAFNNNTSLTDVSFPKCTYIGRAAFGGCTNLSTISFPECKFISTYAFYSCAITVASFSLCSRIGGGAFSGCNSLISLYLESTSQVMVTDNPSIPSTTNIYVPSQLLESYQNASYWSLYSSQFVAI